MRITSLDAQAFGCLKDFSVELGSGLHVFHGPNEGGKSTLQRAILALLYGFYEGDRALRSESAARQRDLPWNDARYAAQLEYELRDGRRYRVARDFANPDLPTTVWDAVTGREVTDEFGRGRHGNVPFMRKQLGMSARVFEACAFVSQGELFEVGGKGGDTARELGETIVSLADSGRRDVSAQAAVKRLDETFKQQVGGPNARTKPLQLARQRLDTLKGKLVEISRVQDEISADAESLERRRAERESLEAGLTRSRYLLMTSDIRELRSKVAQLDGLHEKSQQMQQRVEENRAFAEFPAEERDNVLEIWAKIESLRESVAAAAKRVAEQRGRLTEIERELDCVAARERELGYLRGYPVEKRAVMEALMTSWRSARALDEEAKERLEESRSHVVGILEEYDALEGELGHVSAADIEALVQRLQARSPGPAQGLVRLIQRGLRRFAALVGRLMGRPHQSANDDAGTAYERLPASDAARILEKHRRYLELAPDVRRYRAETAAARRSSEAYQSMTDRLREEIASVVEGVSDLESAYSEFVARCAQRGELESASAQVKSLEGELRSQREAISRHETEQGRLRSLDGQLSARLGSALNRSGSLEELIQAFQDGCRNRLAHDQARAGVKDASERTAMILEGRARAEVERLIEQAEGEVATIVATHPELAGAQSNEPQGPLRDRLNQAESQLRETDLYIQRLATKVNTKLDALPSRAEVEEEIERRAREVAGLERFGAALSLASETISKAMAQAHRDFAPSVGRFLGQGLAHVTGGRYQEARVDPSTLTVTAEVPETGRLEQVDSLSQGTRAAAYLLLRAGLAQHMSGMSEPVPLILDDPLVDVDDARVERFLELLVGLTDEIQVLLFTKDAVTKDWFQRHCADDSRHRLTELDRRRVEQTARLSLLQA